MIMKTRRILLAASVAALFSLAGCMSDEDFLKEKSFVADDQSYFTSEAAVTYALNSCYAGVEYLMVGNSHGQHSWMLQGMGLDTFTGTSGTAEWAANWPAINVGNGTTRHWYDNCYVLVSRCNLVMEVIDANPDIRYSTPTRKEELRAEAQFMRAWAYRCLASMFGNVPIIKNTFTEMRYDYAPNTRQEIWEFMYEDLVAAEAGLPTTPRLTGTITKAAAATYLSEVCLALGKFKEAEQAATRVIDGQCGNYQIMRTRFGSRKDEATDRYGNSLAAPAGAYWDLFRDGGNQDPESGNLEAIWTLQFNYGTFEQGGGGDSWWRVHSQATEAVWTPGILVGNQGTVTDAITKNLIYRYGDDIACYALGVSSSSAKVTAVNGDDGKPDPTKYVATAEGRHLANVQQDSLGARVAYLGQVCVPTRYMWDKSVPGFNLWEDENDFRGSEVMIQRNWYTSGGKKFFDVKKELYARQAAGHYTLTAGDTMNAFLPRLWKFSEDKHPVVNGAVDNKAYGVEIYMIRVPEVYFLRAEAYLAQGDKGKAAADLNEVRSRANASPCSAGDIDIDYILDERARELLGEEHRWVTLNRLSCNPNCTYISDKYPVQDDVTSNTLYARTRKYSRGFENDANTKREKRTDGYGGQYSNITPHNYQFPIPTQVIDASTEFDYPQNPGY